MEHMLNKPVDWAWISQGFVNGLAICSAYPIANSLFTRRRVQAGTWRTAVAAGSFIGGFRLLRQLMMHFAEDLEPTSRRLRLINKYRDFIAGAIATGIGLGVDDHFLGSLLLIWWCLRAVRCCLPQKPLVPHAPTLLMCLAASFVTPSAFLYKTEHQRGYQKFMETMTLNVKFTTLYAPPLYDYIPKPSIHGWDRWVVCDQIRAAGLHPTSSCLLSTLFWGPRISWIAFKMYFPLYLAWNAFRLRWPGVRFLENVARSTVFLTGYTMTEWLGTMLFTAYVSPTITRNQMAAFAWTAGLWTLLERPERRPELATYCMSHAINCTYNRLRQAGWFEHLPRKLLTYLLLVTASGMLTHHHTQHAEFVRRVFGFDGPPDHRTPRKELLDDGRNSGD